jgi:hypothetical protein
VAPSTGAVYLLDPTFGQAFKNRVGDQSLDFGKERLLPNLFWEQEV